MNNFRTLITFLVCGAMASCCPADSYDLCVYGGSASGIVTAYAAAQSGLKVVVIEPTCRLGGLTTGGLGQTDIGNKQVVRGLSLDFYRKVGAHYGHLEDWIFEPSVALDIIEKYASHPKITVVKNHHICAVDKQGKKILSIKVADGGDTLAIAARCFADCSYEGDLMAMSGVSYRTGREDNSEYGETWNGSQILGGHQMPDGIDPYVEPGNPSSGLLWGISPEALKPNGTGDSLIQAYNYRICLTDSAQNMIPITKPENYDPSKYELLLRLFAAQPEKRKLKNYFIWSPMPNCKTDINNNGGFSTDMIGMNHLYSEASWEERQEIIKTHKDYTLGLLYFYANDPRVPEELRAQMAAWGLPKDEYPDTEHWTPQLYVRESRRMVGDYVATQSDCEGRTVAPEGVAYAAYTMDSHNCERIVIEKDGRKMVKNEGNVEVKGGQPYPISYKSIIPKRDECANLFVPVCLSATHIAYGSIRMEPVFMCLGHAAGLAAAMYVRRGLECVQDVEYAAINQAIEKDPFMDGSQPDIIINDDQATAVGEWESCKSKKAFGPTFYKGSEGYVEYSVTAPSAGRYDIYTYQQRKQGVTAYDFADGTSIVVQPDDVLILGQCSSAWHYLRTVKLKKGDALSVRIHGIDGSTAFADAIQLVKKK